MRKLIRRPFRSPLSVALLTSEVGGAVDTTPVTIFQSSPALSNDDNGNYTTVLRTKHVLTADMRDEFRITIVPSATQQLTIAGVCAGKWNNDAGYPDMVDPPVEALFGGVGGFVDQTTEQVSDWTPVGVLAGMVSGNTLITSFQTGANGHCGLKYAAGATGVDAFYQSDTFDGAIWTTQNVSSPNLGFNDINNVNYGISKIETRYADGGGGDPDPDPDPDPVEGDIPLSYDDSRFASNTEETVYRTYNSENWLETSHTFTNKDWDSRPTMWTASVPDPNNDPPGNQFLQCQFTEGMIVTLNQCRGYWREGVRVNGSGTASTTKLILNECYLQLMGIQHPDTGLDHADGIQTFCENVTVEINNSTIRCCDDANSALQLVPTPSGGVIGTGSDAFRWADSSTGTIKFNNVVIRGDGRGVTIFADTGTTRIDWTDVYFIDEDTSAIRPDQGTGLPGAREFYRFDMGENGGNIIIDNWTRVYKATIVDGEIVPGEAIPAPSF